MLPPRGPPTALGRPRTCQCRLPTLERLLPDGLRLRRGRPDRGHDRREGLVFSARRIGSPPSPRRSAARPSESHRCMGIGEWQPLSCGPGPAPGCRMHLPANKHCSNFLELFMFSESSRGPLLGSCGPAPDDQREARWDDKLQLRARRAGSLRLGSAGSGTRMPECWVAVTCTRVLRSAGSRCAQRGRSTTAPALLTPATLVPAREARGRDRLPSRS